MAPERVSLNALRCSSGIIHSGYRSRKLAAIASLAKKFLGSW